MKRIHIRLTAILFCGFAAPQLFGGAGNNNPTGVVGEMNGNITTACNYDPYTANAVRPVTDIVVAGEVGAYPLAFTRISNSRYTIGQDDNGFGLNADFGGDGNWIHSYQWAIDTKLTARGKPTSFAVRYDDGRVVTFSASTNGDPYYRGGNGISDRLQVFWDSSTTGRAYLIRPDGGKVWFSIAITPGGGGWTQYTYTVQGIIDPYGQTTTITGSYLTGLVTITEPGGRWLKLYYTSPPNNPNGYFINMVSASDGRRVVYNYTYDQYLTSPTLTGAQYYDDPTLVATYTYTGSTGNKLLYTAVDPMYGGPMWKIAYTYASGTNPDGTAAVYGQILSENYCPDGTYAGPAVSTLTVVDSTTRKETRADGKTRTFTFDATGLLTSWTDFKGTGASQTYDTNGFVNAVTDFNGHTTNFTKNAFTGAMLTTTFPSTPLDTPAGTPRGVVTYTYGSATCADPNNKDANNPYYVCTATDEGGHTRTYTRDSNKRLIQVSYPDGGAESFQYNSFGEVTNHTLRTSGIETFEYDSRGLLQKYRDPYHASPSNPNTWYSYDSLDRISGVTDALGSGPGDINHTTNFAYNSRGDITVTTLPTDPNDGQRHTTTKAYNLIAGTVASVTDPLNHVTSFTYDDYKRLLTTTTPPRFSGDSMNHASSVFYDANGTTNDYTHTDSNVTWSISPSGKKLQNTYDENRRLVSTTVGVCASGGTGGGGGGRGTPTPTPSPTPPPVCDAATTTFAYDLNGNLTSVAAPKEQPGQQFAGQSTVTSYDERNRPYSVSDPIGDPPTSCMYDAAGRKKSATRANGQVITYDSFDAMNRLLQSTVKQTPNPDAVTKYTYYTSGLLHTMQDPHLVALGSSAAYTYSYDSMGRKTGLGYPPADSQTPGTSESWHYDSAGRLDTFTNRNGNTQRILYDSLSRAYNIAWDDSGLTPTVTIGYDALSRETAINNANASISHTFFDDGLLSSEISTYADAVARTVTYTYDADGNRATTQYPANAYSFTYDYTGRNQLFHVLNNGAAVVTNTYDLDGNLTSSVPNNSTTGSTFSYDGLDRLLHIGHALNGTTRTFDYGYDTVSNRKWVKRDGIKGDVFGYDLADQSTSILLDVVNPDTTTPGPQTINYDANGNRATFSAYGPTDAYTTNNLNQYTQRNSSIATYDTKGNMVAGFDTSTYTYDAQSRILTASKGGTTYTFKYDALNRQVSRAIGGGQTVYNVYDGWSLIGEYPPGATLPSGAYLGGLKDLTNNLYYYHDGSGSTSHLTDNMGTLVESYRYNLQGTPTFYDGSGTQISATQHGVRNLFSGQQWYSELALYDLRNRFYSPDTGRFLQTDPLGFRGDGTNLYRYCQNNAVMFADPLGLWTMQFGLSFTVNIGPAVFSIGGGLAFDGHGNIGVYGADMIGGAGLGASIGLGAGGMESNADTIYGLQGSFIEAGGQGGAEDEISYVQFQNKSGSVTGYGFFDGVGGGAATYGGISNTSIRGTNIFDWFSSSSRPSTSWDVGPDGRLTIIGASVGVDPVNGGPSGNGYGYSFSSAFNNAFMNGVSEDASYIGAAHAASAEISAAVEMGGWAASPGPPRGTAVSEGERHARYGAAPNITWWGDPIRYATAYRWIAFPTSMVANSGGVKGYYRPIAWSTDPNAYVPPPTTTPSGHPIGHPWTDRRR